MFVQKDLYKFVDELANITQSINATSTRQFGDMAPVDVIKDTEGEARCSTLSQFAKLKSHSSPTIRKKKKKPIKKVVPSHITSRKHKSEVKDLDSNIFRSKKTKTKYFKKNKSYALP